MTSYFTNSISKIHILYRMIRNTDCTRYRKKREQNKTSFSEITHDTKEFYNQGKEIAEYQELEEVSKPTNYYENLT